MKKTILFVIAVVFIAGSVFGQRRTSRALQKSAKALVVAVLNDGKTIEPIAYIENGKLSEPVNGSDDAAKIAAFNKTYYPVRKTYPMYFGGKPSGAVTVTSADHKRECSANMADVTTRTTRTTLKGNIMAIATNAPLKKPGSGVRRLPTAVERAEIENLVREHLMTNKVSADAVKILRYQNLTAVDVDDDGTAELIGSYWAETGPRSRALLAFIADKGPDGKYAFGFANYDAFDQEKVMSGDIKDVDTGVYHERLLDLFDVDGDGVSEVFTYVMSFEGAGFNVYKRQAGKWSAIFEGSNYHCGY